MEPPPDLLRMPPELVHHIVESLPEDSLTSLSRTCTHLNEVLNVDSLWARFVDNKARSLESQPQHLTPACSPDPALCENRQHLDRKHHLANNWRNKVFVKYKIANHRIFEQILLFKDIYLIIFGMLIQLWDIRGKPVLHCTFTYPESEICDWFVIGDNLVQVASSRIQVFTVNIEDKKLTFLYMFLVTDDKVSFELCERRGSRWQFARVENYLVFQTSTEDNQRIYFTIHVWDIVNASKVGVFKTPVLGKNNAFHSSHNNDWFFRNCLPAKSVYFKFNFVSKQFSENVFKTNEIAVILFHKGCCIKFAEHLVEDEDLLLQVFDFETSAKLAERQIDGSLFPDEQIGSCLVIVEDKLVVECFGRFEVVEALSLKLLITIPKNMQLVRHISVFGQMYMILLSPTDGELKLLDVEKNEALLISESGGVNHSDKVLGSEPFTKVIIWEGDDEISVLHFW